MSSWQWHFWIDVGGTFTDALARDPEGDFSHAKVLSSSLVKGKIGSWLAPSTFVDPLRRGDGPQFWDQYAIALIDARGQTVSQTYVQEFDSEGGRLRLVDALSPSDIQRATNYELISDELAPILAVRRLLGLARCQPLPALAMDLGTTRGTNALLTRCGARTALVTTRGFVDLLRIGDQTRPELFTLAVRKPPPLFETSVEIDERIGADGRVMQPLQPAAAAKQLAALRQQGIQSLAICLMHGYRNPEHELQLARLAGAAGFSEVSISSQVAPLIKIVPRAETTVLDAHLNPVLRDYTTKLSEQLPAKSRLRMMTSSGGLVSPQRFSGKDSILSGPAGGVVGCGRAAQQCGFSRAIGFDMGGTSTDVSRFDGQFERQYETTKAGVRIIAPMMAIETVAAGGGSVCRFDGTRLLVGPESAAAHPGPACYGRGGPLAITDVNLFLGRLCPQRFPFPLDLCAVEAKLDQLRQEIARQASIEYSAIELAEGFLKVANANMAAAIRTVSVARGYDVRQYVLVAFGGAAPQHACAVADELGIRRILIHPLGSLLSAAGIRLAEPTSHRVCSVRQPYNRKTRQELQPRFQQMAREATAELVAEGATPQQVDVSRWLDLRYQGTDTFLTVATENAEQDIAEFEEMHRQMFGYLLDAPIQIGAARVEVVARKAPQVPTGKTASQRTVTSRVEQACVFQGQSVTTPVFDRTRLRPGDQLQGPAILVDELSAAIVEPGWQAAVLGDLQLLLRRSKHSSSGAPALRRRTGAADPTQLEIFNRHFYSIAEQMGITLRNTSVSVNVKERLDFSCAVFNARGELVVNAPHIPVHLGAMSQTVRATMELNPDLAEGDVVVTNDPFHGGSHLPDITVVTPVFDSRHQEIAFFVASRSHHAEIGGIAPGSMPPAAANLAQEGVLIRNFKVIAAGTPRMDQLGQLLRSGPYPSRKPGENIADIVAQIAANARGARDIQTLLQRYSPKLVFRYMDYIQQAAMQKTSQALARLPDGRHTFSDRMDNGAAIRVTVDKRGPNLSVDFAGTDPPLADNFNANPAIVNAAVMYCVRCLIDEDIPLNEGILKPVAIHLPSCFLNPVAHQDPARCPAMAAGNVETSQRIVDVILGALGAAAASQGTMNNVLLGDGSFGYYETICGGCGATAGCDGASAVHTHMTNTRMTDPEVLEARFPLQLEEFSIRHGSGGAGRWRGGDGVLRRIRFLRPLSLSLLTGRRGEHRPYGMQGGAPGAAGFNRLHQPNGRVIELPYACQLEVQMDDRLIIGTPGGGGYGTSE